MKKLPIGIQTFSEIIQNNYVYVDKTAIIYTLITTGKLYFLSRPRRFGKSLLVSTLAEIFSGNKELFTGLAIASLPYEWEKHPVITISFSDLDCTSPENLQESLKRYLHNIAKKYRIKLQEANTPGAMFQDLVEILAEQNSVVLLIDEYDYAILKHIHAPENADSMRETVKNFYGVIKGLDKHLKFVFLTGVSKFTKTSIFSGLNNLNDISLNANYNALLGYTAPEITTCFESYLQIAADDNNCSINQLLIQIATWYDGYQFSKKNNVIKIFNPFSVLLFLSTGEFSNYWFATGTPTFLINLLKSKNYPIADFEAIEATESELGSFDIDQISLKTLLYQTGYLTIQSYDSETTNFLLSYSNKECIKSLTEYIFASMTEVSGAYLNTIASALMRAFVSHNYELLQTTITKLFAIVPYTIHIGEEKYYQTIFYLALKMIGANIIVEQPTNIGRIDAVMQTNDTYFIIEFKINTTATKALEQIKEKKYYQPYQGLDKKIVLIGIAFDTTIKNISSVKFFEMNDL
jgi:hypothetical protein